MASAPTERHAPTRRWREWPDALWPAERAALVGRVMAIGAVGAAGWVAWWATHARTVPEPVRRWIETVLFGLLGVWVLVLGAVVGGVVYLGVYTPEERAALLDPRWPVACRFGPAAGGARWERWRRADVGMIRAILRALPSGATIEEVLLVHRPRRWMRRGLLVRWREPDGGDESGPPHVRDPEAVLIAGCTPWHGDATQGAGVWTAWVAPAPAARVHQEQGARWAPFVVVSSRWPVPRAHIAPPAEVAWDRIDDDRAVRLGVVPPWPVAEAAVTPPSPEVVPEEGNGSTGSADLVETAAPSAPAAPSPAPSPAPVNLGADAAPRRGRRRGKRGGRKPRRGGAGARGRRP